ncbi:hypothetical protein FSP39_014871 [Pinctada imbricata]|uniref:PHD-type domain-containing protein n=1 Tax=Pinctada imbricata TaxID=66713 RepID=A0AA89BT37_PINIB|nr:hypothetical protein FSP39_014871 [Pinctada imbricata]
MPYAFKKYDPYIKKDKGCRTQLPLKLGFAATIHKCQGMSLERVDIDCRGIFQYGQLVVAVSRATTKKGLRIQNFKKEYIQRPPANILRFYENVTKEYTDDNVCCTESFCNIDYDPVSTPFIASVTENDTSDEEGDEEAMLELIDSYSDNVEEHVELPAGVDIISAIETIKHASPANQIQENENLAVNYLKDHPDNVKQFVSKVWWKLVQYKTDAFKQDQIDNKAINSFYVKFNELLSSDLYKKDVTKLYDCLFTTVTMEQFNVAFQLVAYIRKKVVSEEVSTIKQKAEERAENERGKEFTESEGGRGKIRYLGGWCLSRIKNTIRKRIMDNVYKAKNVKLVNNLIVKKDMIEHLLVSESEITESSKFVESLHETCRRQNIRKGLTHISDDCFNFFKTLDREVRKLESNANLQLHGKNFPLFQKTELSNMPSVTTEWKELFVQCDVNVQASFIHEIFAEVIEKYLRMSNAQLRKDYMTSQHLKKSEATRKQIKMRTETAMKTVFNMTTIMNDTSNQKIISHRRLQSEVMKSNKFLVDKFKKTELQTLCAFYGVSYKSQQTKNALSEALIPVITAADNMDSHTATVSSTSCEPSSSGHVSGNKRKRTVTEYPCGVCLHDASSNSVGCDRCDKWFHGVCVGEDLDALSDSEWFCPKCRK